MFKVVSRNLPADLDSLIADVQACLPAYQKYLGLCWREAIHLAEFLLIKPEQDPNFDSNLYRQYVFELANQFFSKNTIEIAQLISQADSDGRQRRAMEEAAKT